MISKLHKAGFVTIVGKPNSGKSTLLNALLGQKLSIVNEKPQTTRKSILGILSDDDYQIIFYDTPGILIPKYLLQEKMLDYISESVIDADIIIFLLDASNENIENIFFEESNCTKILNKSTKPKILLLNKIDKSNEEKIKGLTSLYEQLNIFDKIIPLSALLKANIQTILQTLIELLPEHPKFFPEDEIANENERFFVQEFIRGKILEFYKDEIPYSCEVSVEEFKERNTSKDFILANIFVEKDSQKKIIIGKAGEMIKKLSENSRREIEKFLDRSIYLELRVKVRDNWRKNESMLKRFGYIKQKD